MSQDTVSADAVLDIERLIAASPERLFELWTEPDLLVKWWGPEGYDVPSHSLDVRPGGNWRTVMRSPEGKSVTVSGVYRVIDKPRRLVFTWAWNEDDGSRGHETEVTVTFEPAPGGTRLKLHQEIFQSKERRDSHNKGWASTLNWLARVA